MSDKVRINARPFRDDDRSGSGGETSAAEVTGLPEEVVIPENFRGVLQINIQRATETETNTQTASPTITVTAVQNQLTQVQAGMANMQAALQAMQTQLQTLMMLLLSAPNGFVDRQRLVQELARVLQVPTNPPSPPK